MNARQKLMKVTGVNDHDPEPREFVLQVWKQIPQSLGIHRPGDIWSRWWYFHCSRDPAKGEPGSSDISAWMVSERRERRTQSLQIPFGLVAENRPIVAGLVEGREDIRGGADF